MQKRLKIFLDHQIFTIQNFGGISRVFTELYKEFKKSDVIEPILPMQFSDNEYIDEIKGVRSVFKKKRFFLKTLFYYFINRIYSTLVLIKGDFDIFQPTYYDPYFLPFLGKKPFVLLIHDMTHEIFPEAISLKDRTIEWKKKLVYKADRIITISENTKRDILKFYDIEESKITVVSWGTSIVVKKTNIELPDRYILFVGNRTNYKNFEFFFKSVVPLLKKEKDLYLVCAGSSNFSEEEKKMIEESGVSNRVKHIRFRDEELGYIYSKAVCFVFPSLYEGFGIPVLEAFACNCPAVISNTSSLPEVGGNAVEYFNPKDIKSIESSVRRVVNDEVLRKEMIRKGKERLKMFGWEKTSKEFLNVYNEIIEERGNND